MIFKLEVDIYGFLQSMIQTRNLVVALNVSSRGHIQKAWWRCGMLQQHVPPPCALHVSLHAPTGPANLVNNASPSMMHRRTFTI